MTDLGLIFLMAPSVLGGFLLGLAFIYLAFRLDKVSRARRLPRVTPPAASRGDRPSLP